MKKPTKLKVGGVEYKIFFDQAMIRDHIAQEGEVVYGYTEHEALHVVISEIAAVSLKREILLHETLHTICGMLGIFDSKDEEERVVKIMSPVLLGVLRDNPEFITYLLEEA